MKLGIAWPIINRILDRDFVISFTVMDKPSFTLLVPTYEIYGFPKDIADARNGLVVQAKQVKCDVLILMDTDQVYPVDTVTKLIAGLEYFDAVGAVVHRRYPPFEPILKRGELGKHLWVPEEEAYSGELIEIDATGCGCIAYNMKVFKEIDPPWFELIHSEHGKPVGEDIRFCHKMKQAGFKIGADTSVQIDHLTTFRVNRQTHELFSKMRMGGKENGL